MTMRPSAPHATRESVEEALDEALAETFPASDAINLLQWSEMEPDAPAVAPEPAIIEPPGLTPPTAPDSPVLDRAALYRLGPTAFCA